MCKAKSCTKSCFLSEEVGVSGQVIELLFQGISWLPLAPNFKGIRWVPLTEDFQGVGVLRAEDDAGWIAQVPRFAKNGHNP